MNDFASEAYTRFRSDWALLSAGTIENHNAMTVGWGGVGCLWNKPVITVYVRPNRHTFRYLEENEFFTVSFYPEQYKKALGIMGSRSGLDCDKDALAGLTPVAMGESTTYLEAQRTYLCRKLYAQELNPEQFPQEVRARFYGSEPAHRMYIAEILEIK